MFQIHKSNSYGCWAWSYGHYVAENRLAGQNIAMVVFGGAKPREVRPTRCRGPGLGHWGRPGLGWTLSVPRSIHEFLTHLVCCLQWEPLPSHPRSLSLALLLWCQQPWCKSACMTLVWHALWVVREPGRQSGNQWCKGM